MTNCESCSRYVYDEQNDMYCCTVDLDEDEMCRFVCGANYDCPYYSADDEYSVVRKQV